MYNYFLFYLNIPNYNHTFAIARSNVVIVYFNYRIDLHYKRLVENENNILLINILK